MGEGHGTFWRRLTRGIRWSWIDERYRGLLPGDLDDAVMGLESRDRLHAKQGRSTARVIFHPAAGTDPEVLSVYLKRHYRLPWPTRIAALVRPDGCHSPGAAEWSHLERARALGIPVPDVAAAGERIGPWAGLQSYLLVVELTGCQELNVALPRLEQELAPADFADLKRRIIAEMARIAAALHAARCFHKDLYLCHFFLDVERLGRDPRDVRLTLIDLHRLAEHRLLAERWRRKDLGQLLYSTDGVDGVDGRDALRFWMHYRRRLGLSRPRRRARMIRAKAARYLAHNRRA